ncbi:MAG: OB-fold domain-containing protein [Dehalococcoidia bacterium]
MAEFLGAMVAIAPNDPEHLGYLQAAGEGRFVLQRCTECSKLRYPIGNACPFCTALGWEWSEASGKGTIYSYEVVMHPIHPSFRDQVPYPIVLVELDEQRGIPTRDDGLRVLSMLVTPDDRPESTEAVAIGLRAEVQFTPLGDGLALPRFRLSNEPPESTPWSLKG